LQQEWDGIIALRNHSWDLFWKIHKNLANSWLTTQVFHASLNWFLDTNFHYIHILYDILNHWYRFSLHTLQDICMLISAETLSREYGSGVRTLDRLQVGIIQEKWITFG